MKKSFTIKHAYFIIPKKEYKIQSIGHEIRLVILPLSIPREIAHLDRLDWAVIPVGLSSPTAVVEHSSKM